MNYLRSALSDARQRYHVNRIICAILLQRNNSAESIAEAVNFADRHPELVLTVMRNQLSYAKPDVVHRVLILLETLVGRCNYSFHIALAHYKPIQDKILALAIRRAEDAEQRRTQHLARLTLLEYSRLFRDDVELAELAQLATLFEFKTHKNLMRCLNVHRRRVRFKEPCSTDVVLLRANDIGANPSDAEASRAVAPIRISHVEVCPCMACGYLNAPSALVCASCETPVLTVGNGSSSTTMSSSGGGSGNSHLNYLTEGEDGGSTEESVSGISSGGETLASVDARISTPCGAARNGIHVDCSVADDVNLLQGTVMDSYVPTSVVVPKESMKNTHENGNGCSDVTNSLNADSSIGIAH